MEFAQKRIQEVIRSFMNDPELQESVIAAVSVEITQRLARNKSPGVASEEFGQ